MWCAASGYAAVDPASSRKQDGEYVSLRVTGAPISRRATGRSGFSTTASHGTRCPDAVCTATARAPRSSTRVTVSS